MLIFQSWNEYLFSKCSITTELHDLTLCLRLPDIRYFRACAGDKRNVHYSGP